VVGLLPGPAPRTPHRPKDLPKSSSRRVPVSGDMKIYRVTLGLTLTRYLETVGRGSSGRGHAACVQSAIRDQANRKVVGPRRRAAILDDAQDPLETALAGVRVLVVEDNLETLGLLSALLRLCGATVRMASSVGEALDRLQVWRPDVLVADLVLPDETGYELLRHLRERPGPLSYLPAIAITGDVVEDHGTRAAAAGFVILLVKPVGLGDLVAAIQLSVSGASGAGPADPDEH
jgi:CheY-like chemotaxis protein